MKLKRKKKERFPRKLKKKMKKRIGIIKVDPNISSEQLEKFRKEWQKAMNDVHNATLIQPSLE